MDIVETTLQYGSIDFLNWCLSNYMHINLSKTSAMAIGTRQKLKNSYLITTYLNDEILQNTTDTQRLLGITIDNPSAGIFKLTVYVSTLHGELHG